MALAVTQTKVSKRPLLEKILGAPSWTFASDCVEASLTEHGGHLAPVRFHTARGIVQPFAIAPWGKEILPRSTPAALKTLRGDFFCAPFGGNHRPWHGEKHPVHGETASQCWKFVSTRVTPAKTEFTVSMRPAVRGGEVIKKIILRRGETNLYCRHELKSFNGPMTVGHHAMLSFGPKIGLGQVLLSPWRNGQVRPRPFESPALGGYSSLKVGAKFTQLNQVPLANGMVADLTRYPAREGFDDLVMMSARPSAKHLAWTTVTFPEAGWLWFGLKDVRTLASTLLWHSNGGRHYPPWNGRHRRVLGLEEVTSYFDFGLAESVSPNPLSQAGIPTSITLDRTQTLVINYIMGVIALPASFKRLRSVRLSKNQLVVSSFSGEVAHHPVDLSFFNENL